MDPTPCVSILLPNLNTMSFLPERINSILSQTFENWELIIADSYSDDGAWEYLSTLAATNPKIEAFQLPRGLYQAWNACIEKARGRYIYIATSDDTMQPDCLEKMVQALDDHPECDLCDSVLRLIDENGQEIELGNPRFVAHYWHVDFPRDRKHIRMAPHDYFLHFGGKTVYTSITQLLIRKSLFEKTGFFPTDFGCSADFLWGMRAGLYGNVIFIPEKLASWRLHDNQLTTAVNARERINYNFHLMSEMSGCSLEELDDEHIRKQAQSVMELIPFKEMLLPAKRNRLQLVYFMRGALLAGLRHPLLSMEFVKKALAVPASIPRSLRLINAYDNMILRRIKRLKLDSLIRLESDFE